MTIESTTSAVKGGVAKRFAALFVAAATLLAGGVFSVSAAPSALADDAETNVALNAEKGNDNAPDVQVSYVTGWNSTAAINDDSLDGNASYGGWGTWGNTSASETATYTWNRAVTTSKSVGYYWTNVKTGDGGVPLPKDVSIEYLNADSGQYETVPNLKVDKTFPADDELDATNPVYGPYTYTFDQVTTKSMKLVVNKKANDNKGITVTEWQVFGTSAALPVDPGDPGAFLDVQQVAVRTTPGVDPTSKLPAEVWATPQDGPSIKVPVTWETVPADAYATAGTTAEVKGTTAAGTYDNIKVAAGQATATIGVYDQLNTEVTDVNTLGGFDDIIVASGSIPRTMPSIPGFEKTLTFTELLKDKKEVGDKVLFIGGGQSSCEAAYDLVLQGKHPIIVEYANDLVAAQATCLANTSFLRDAMEYHKVPTYLESTVTEIKDNGVTVKNVKTGETFFVECDNVVNGIGFVPTPVGGKDNKQVFRVGDCVAIGNLRTVIWRAWDVCMKI